MAAEVVVAEAEEVVVVVASDVSPLIPAAAREAR
jgi:hypothetical protein